MNDFISEIKKIRTEELIYKFSEISIEMFQSETPERKNISLQTSRYGLLQNKEVLLTAWDVLAIEYLSAVNSNDYKNSKRIVSVGELVNLYRGYEEDKKDLEYLKDGSIDVVFRTILGMTAEQFQFQKFGDYFERFSRNYYILVAAENFEHKGSINVSGAVETFFEYSIEDYLSVLLMVYWLCSKCPEPLSAPENIYKKTDSTIFTKENISKFVQHYSCTYDDLRKSVLGKQLLYSKPFIKTERGNKYLASSLAVVAMLIGNGLYWLVRDYYQKQGSKEFPYKFGLLFEDYIKDIASKYCKQDEWKVIPQGKEKGADFAFTLGKIMLIVESKSALLKLDVKQQTPNLNSINDFFERNIEESYKQLNKSFEEFSKSTKLPIAKIILLYDEFSNTAIIEHSLVEVFKHDHNCFVMTIRKFEILLYFYYNDKEKCDKIFDKMIDCMNSNAKKTNIEALYDEFDINNNPHLSGNMDYFKKQMEHFKDNMQNN